MGPWTFGHLMTQMANQPVTGIHPSTFVRNWLNKWMNDQVINGWTVAKRQQMQTLVIDPWVAASGGPHRPLNLAIAPFKLLAIVNRVDLRNNTVYGGGNAGEGRFVFGVIDRRPTGKPDPYTGQPAAGCGVTQFTVIFEYGIDRRGCGIRDWGRQWHNLRNFVLGSARYNHELQAITDQFTRANAAPHKPNRSALNQLRTNEIELLLNPPTNPVWELREFKIGGDAGVNPGQLEEATVKRTPDLTRNRTALRTQFINANEAAILAETHDVPLTFMGQNFLGGSSLAPRPTIVDTHWNHPRRPLHHQPRGAAQVLAQHLQRLPHGRDQHRLHAHQAGRVRHRGRALRLHERHRPGHQHAALHRRRSGHRAYADCESEIQRVPAAGHRPRHPDPLAVLLRHRPPRPPAHPLMCERATS